jgi:hypothetical protein
LQPNAVTRDESTIHLTNFAATEYDPESAANYYSISATNHNPNTTNYHAAIHNSHTASNDLQTGFFFGCRWLQQVYHCLVPDLPYKLLAAGRCVGGTDCSGNACEVRWAGYVYCYGSIAIPLPLAMNCGILLLQNDGYEKLRAYSTGNTLEVCVLCLFMYLCFSATGQQ